MSNTSIKNAFQRYWQHTKDKIVESTADWNQNDETALDYVKNRTHWSETETVVIFDNTVEILESPSGVENVLGTRLDEGKIYIVEFDGVEYTCLARNDGFDEIYIGNQTLSDGWEFLETIESNEPFFIASDSYEWSIIRANAGSHKIRVYYNIETVHKLDQKFLPVDIDWNNSDETSVSYIKNRTHWTDKKEDIEVLPETFLSNGTDGGDGVREFTFPANFSLTEGEIYLVHWNGEPYTVECKRQEELTYVGNIGVVDDGPDTGEPFCVGLSDNNSSVYVYTSSDITEATVSIMIPGEETIHKLEMKYLPEAISSKYVEKEVPYLVEMGWSEPFNGYTNNHTSKPMDLYKYLSDGDIIYVTVNVTGSASTSSPITNLIGAGVNTGEFIMSLLLDSDRGNRFLSNDIAIPVLVDVSDNHVTATLNSIIVREDSVGLYFTGTSLLVLVDNTLNINITFTVLKSEQKTAKTSTEFWSSTEGSTKSFTLSVDDSGTVSVVDDKNEVRNEIPVCKADWNVNDETSPTYIKNRTHWTEEVITEIIPETQVTLTEDDYEGAIETTATFVKGRTYVVTWNGVEYTCIGQEVTAEGVTLTGIGDLSIMGLPGVVGVGNGEPFVVMTCAALLGANVMAVLGLVEGVYDVTLSMKSIVEDVHKLPMKYLPDGYPYIEGEEKVLANFNGILAQDSIGTFAQPILTSGYLVDGEAYTVFFNGEEYTDVVASVNENAPTKVELRVDTENGEKWVKLTSDDNNPSLMGCVVYDDTITTDKDDYTVSIKVVHGKQTIHRIDYRYLPEGYPYVECGGTNSVVLAELSVEVDPTEPIGPITQPMELVAGNTYTVVWQGAEYSVIGQPYSEDGMSCVVLGNMELAMGTGDTGEPFVIMYVPGSFEAEGYSGVIRDLSGSGDTTITLAIYGGGAEVIHTIDPKFLPEGYPYIEPSGAILPQTTFIFDDPTEPIAPIMQTLDLVVGETYVVSYAGTEYQTVAQVIEDDGIIATCLGNTSIFTGIDSGEPFCIFYAPGLYESQGYNGMIADLSESGVSGATVEIIGSEVIHKMDNRFLDLVWLPTYEKGSYIVKDTTVKNFQTISADFSQVLVGQEIIVFYDGIKYELTVSFLEDGRVFGDIQAIINGNLGTVPFAGLIQSDTSATLVTTDNDTHTISIFNPNTDVIEYNKLPVEFLPDDISGGSIKNLIDGSTEGSLRTVGSKEENDTYTIGANAFAEGGDTEASGYSSHAEGYMTTASGSNSHAEGGNTKATGSNSHAEGYGSEASGNESHAEGSYSKASGMYSHAEGNQGKALGEGSHAEGFWTIASGAYSHTEGCETAARGEYQHVQGKYNIVDTSNKYAHIVGNGTEYDVRSNAHTLDWDGNAWFAGKVTVGSDNKELSTAGKDVKGTVYTINGSDVTAGTGAEIFNNYSYNIATGVYSHAEGTQTIASGTAAHAEGSTTKAIGDYSHSEGLLTEASAFYSHAEGDRTLASNRSAHAEGGGTIASGQYSHAEGMWTTASGDYSHAEGFGNRTARSTSITGDANATTYTANEWSTSFIIGQILYYKDQSTETYAKITAIDKDNLSITLDKTLSSQGLNDANVYFIYGIAIGQYSHSEGYYTSASGAYSHAEGKNTIASSNGSHAEGSSTIAGSEYQHVQGKFNIEDTSNKYAHIVGNGTADDTRSNAHTLDWNGNAWFKGKITVGPDNLELSAVGQDVTGEVGTINGITYTAGEGAEIFNAYSTIRNRAYGNYSHAEGYMTTASGDYSHAEGNGTHALGDRSHGEGGRTTASGDYSHAEGDNTIASGDSSHAEGFYTVAIGGNSHAEGYGWKNTLLISGAANATSYTVSVWNDNIIAGRVIAFNNRYALITSTDRGGLLITLDKTLSDVELIDASVNIMFGTAYGAGSHAEGTYTSAVGHSSHAEGGNTIASGGSSHAEGSNTIASSRAQHVQGKFNIEDTENKYAHIVGNGTADDARSNAHTLDWDGNAWYRGDVESETSFVLKSSTEGSNKKFRITIDDTGTLTIAEI